MAPTNLNEVKGELLHLNQTTHELATRREQCRKKRMHFQRIFLLFNDFSKRKETLLKVSLLSMLLLLSVSHENTVTERKTRSCRRHIKILDGGTQCGTHIQTNVSRRRLESPGQPFRLSLVASGMIFRSKSWQKNQFQQKQGLVYASTDWEEVTTCIIAEITGFATPTVCNIVIEVSQSVIENLWDVSVEKHWPTTEAEFLEKMIEMESMWQFPCCLGAVDGCHIPIRCYSGGKEANKEYHNFKNFYSVVLIGLVDAKCRFIWASCGFPGNSHDSIIFQAMDLFQNVTEGNLIPKFAKNKNGVMITPLILGDSAFPFRSWLVKPYTNAVLSPQERYFNYRLSRARMVTEGAYGRLKGCWRVLLRKCKNHKETVKLMTLACIVLHNICIDLSDTTPTSWDLNYDNNVAQWRPEAEVRETLKMWACPPSRGSVNG